MNQELTPADARKANTSFAKSRIVRRLLLLPFVAIASLYFLSMTSSRPENLGVQSGQLAACPESPNCVSTQTERESHRMSPIPFSESKADVINKIKTTVDENFSRVSLITETDGYLHFEFRSLIFRFVDDVEFLVNDESSLIHFRSAARVGHSDLGRGKKFGIWNKQILEFLTSSSSNASNTSGNENSFSSSHLFARYFFDSSLPYFSSNALTGLKSGLTTELI